MTHDPDRTKAFAFNWRQSPAHVWFLTTFLRPRQPDDHHLGVDWRAALGEEPARAIERSQVQGVLTRAPLAVRLDAQYNRDELRELLRRSELHTSGNKGELIDRLIQHDVAAMGAITSVELLQCTDYGRSLAEQYLADPQSIIMHTEDATEEARTAGQLPTEQRRRVLRWLLLEGIVLGVAGNAAYDLLKELARRAGEALPEPEWGKATHLSASVILEWCFVPGGYFLMGPKHNERRVYVPSFDIGCYPITNRQYLLFVRASGHRPPGYWPAGQIPRGKSDHPVARVNYDDAVAFCAWATRVTRLEIDLPTEREWEKAALGTDGRDYPWGAWKTGRCNTSESGITDTTPVDRFPNGRSPCGAYDMAGNVWEWTDSWYGENRRLRGLRGGSWHGDADDARVALPLRSLPLNSFDEFGFRVVCRLPSHHDH